MRPEFLDQASKRAGTRYGAFLLALTGVLAKARTMDPQDAQAYQVIRDGSQEVAQEFLSTEMELLRADLYQAQIDAARTARGDMGAPYDPEVEWDPMGDEVATWAMNELGAQVWRDINALTVARRNAALSARFGRAISAPVEPTFAFKDRAGRTYPAQAYVTQLYRHALVGFGVETFINEVGLAGHEEAFVTHPEPAHPHNKARVSLPLDPEVMNVVFHPNSRAFLTILEPPDVPA